MRKLLAVAIALCAFPASAVAQEAAPPGVDFASDAVSPLSAEPRARGAYVTAGRRWPTRTITYHNGVKGKHYRDAIREAARAWNRSGVRIRLRAAPKSRAKIRITRLKNSGTPTGNLGYATLGYIAPGVRTHHPVTGQRVAGNWMWLALPKPGDPDDPAAVMQALENARIVAHEFGHNLGLAHEDGKCATMASKTYLWKDLCASVYSGGNPGQYVCRLLEKDDISGARKLYGGKVRPAAKYCDAPDPAPPRDVTLSVSNHYTDFDGTVYADIKARWTGIAETTSLFTLQSGSCDTNPANASYTRREWVGDRYADVAHLGNYPSGSYCFTVWVQGNWGQTSKKYAQRWITVG